jgi:hypothetical protein
MPLIESGLESSLSDAGRTHRNDAGSLSVALTWLLELELELVARRALAATLVRPAGSEQCIDSLRKSTGVSLQSGRPFFC